MKRICGKCKIEKPASEFNKDKNKKLGISYRCKNCNRESTREWHKANQERSKDLLRANYLKNRNTRLKKAKKWRIDNADRKREYNRKRKALLKSVQTKRYTEAQVLAVYGEICHLCNGQIDMSAPRWTGAQGWESGLQIDHVIPISKGGPDSLENVRPSHGKCNLFKSANVLELHSRLSLEY